MRRKIMDIAAIFLLAISVSMDAFAVSVCKGLSMKNAGNREGIICGAWFGGFQGLMPLAGYFLGVSFKEYIVSFDHWIAFVLLGIIGFNMIHESLSKGCERGSDDFSPKAMLPLAVATSIDALAVGVSLAFLKEPIFASAAAIGITTALLSAVGLYIGNIFGCKYKSKAEFMGGAVLILIGIKILVEHTL